MTALPSSPTAEYRAGSVPDFTGYRRHLPGRPNGRHGRRLAASVVVILIGGTACTASPSDSAAEAETSSGPTSSSTSASPASPAGAVSGASVDWASVADEAESSVVSISVSGESGSGEGSGVVIDDDGHVLTNNHVVAPAVDGGGIQVALSDARVFEAAVVGADPDTDLAVVQIQAAPDDLTALEFGNSDTVAVGQPVMALGNPLGLSNTVTVGIVSALDRPVTTQNASSTPGEAPTPVVTNAIQTDAAVNPGNSGGALVNDSGQLVGINSSIATLGASDGGQGGSIGLGFAIPSNEAEWVARQLIETGDVDHAYLGVSLESAIVSVDGVARQGAGITDVAEGTAAAEGGLQAGEAITQVDGETVRGADSLIAQIREREPGTRVTLTVVSEGRDTREISVEFGTRDEP